MKVRLRVGWAGPERRHARAGAIVTVDEKLGRMLLKTNQADPVEAATVKAPEQAAETKPPEARAVVSHKYPAPLGGGWFELSNKEKVQGKDEAEAAEKALHE